LKVWCAYAARFARLGKPEVPDPAAGCGKWLAKARLRLGNAQRRNVSENRVILIIKPGGRPSESL
jgi:hypothetical protein